MFVLMSGRPFAPAPLMSVQTRPPAVVFAQTKNVTAAAAADRDEQFAGIGRVNGEIGDGAVGQAGSSRVDLREGDAEVRGTYRLRP